MYIHTLRPNALHSYTGYVTHVERNIQASTAQIVTDHYDIHWNAILHLAGCMMGIALMCIAHAWLLHLHPLIDYTQVLYVVHYIYIYV